MQRGEAWWNWKGLLFGLKGQENQQETHQNRGTRTLMRSPSRAVLTDCTVCASVIIYICGRSDDIQISDTQTLRQYNQSAQHAFLTVESEQQCLCHFQFRFV